MRRARGVKGLILLFALRSVHQQKQGEDTADEMKLRKELILLLLVMSASAEPEVSKKRSETSDEEAEEDVSLEEHPFEHFRELKALHDTILKMVPASEPYLSDKITKRKEEVENEPKTKEESSVMRNVWMKSSNLRIEEEDTEAWSEEEQFEPLNDEVQEPLTPEQQEGTSKDIKYDYNN